MTDSHPMLDDLEERDEDGQFLETVPSQPPRLLDFLKRRGKYILGGVLAAAIVGIALAIILTPGSNSPSSPKPDYFATPDSRNQFFIQSLNGTEPDLRSDALHITSKPHLAGTPDEIKLAGWMEEQFQALGVTLTQKQPFSVLLPFPNGSRVEITYPPERVWVAKNEEDGYAADPSSEPSINIPIFNGYSFAGVAEAEVVYVNYGREEDFAYLLDQGVNLSGTIVLVRYGKIFRANKCQQAEQHGAVGCLIYSDPIDDGFVKGEPYPTGPWRPSTGVQRGTVWIGNGDPMTPGWPSLSTAPRLTEAELYEDAPTDDQPLPRIPIHPLSWRDAQPILMGLGASNVTDTNRDTVTVSTPPSWIGGVPDCDYHIGPGPVRVRMAIERTLARSTIHQVLGIIPGAVEPDRWVIVGAHRDAWDLGAMDPGSGTITLLNVARGLGRMLAEGWRPRRTIILMSHGAEEQGLVGSCEWVETHQTLLEQRGVVYFNADLAVEGRQFFSPSGTPTLERLLRRAAALVPAPEDQRPAKQSVLDMWDPEMPVLDALGSGSDFTAFQQHTGMLAADLRFSGDAQGYEGVYHSAYDSFYWLEHFGDPGFAYHVAASRVLGLAAIMAADDEVIDVDYTAYAPALMLAVQQTKDSLASVPGGAPAFDFSPLELAIDELQRSAAAVQQNVERSLWQDALQLRSFNDRLMLTERTFIHFPKAARGWYAHALFSPGRYDAYSSDAFPVLGDCIHDRDWKGVAFQIDLLATIIQIAAKTLASEAGPPFFPL